MGIPVRSDCKSEREGSKSSEHKDIHYEIHDSKSVDFIRTLYRLFQQSGTDETENKADPDTATHAIPEADTLWRNGHIVSITRRTIPKLLLNIQQEATLYAYIAENLVYPAEAIESEIEGNVMVVSTVDQDAHFLSLTFLILIWN